jgi:hypothetical protein
MIVASRFNVSGEYGEAAGFSSTSYWNLTHTSSSHITNTGGGGVHVDATLGEWVTSSVVRTGGTNYSYKNGIYFTTGASGTYSFDNGTMFFLRGGNNFMGTQVEYAMFINRAINAQQVMSLYRDPYQFLIPA